MAVAGSSVRKLPFQFYILSWIYLPRIEYHPMTPRGCKQQAVHHFCFPRTKGWLPHTALRSLYLDPNPSVFLSLTCGDISPCAGDTTAIRAAKVPRPHTLQICRNTPASQPCEALLRNEVSDHDSWAWLLCEYQRVVAWLAALH